MATKTIAWGAGSGNITLTYTGQGNGSVSVESDANDLYEERVKSISIKTSAGSPTVTKTVTIKQQGKSLGWTTKDFEFTGGVQSIELPKGKYKLQCWGAQGGSSYRDSATIGSKGGYSEGVLTLTETTTLYVFVGGKGSFGSNESMVNGGWNGGGASVGKSSYNNDNEYGISYPGSGGGSTDICTVTSSMSYSNGRTDRGSASLLSRFIVAGGGAGGCFAEKISTIYNNEEAYDGSASVTTYYPEYSDYYNGNQKSALCVFNLSKILAVGGTYRIECSQACYRLDLYNSGISSMHQIQNGDTITIKNNDKAVIWAWGDELTRDAIINIYKITQVPSEKYSSYKSYAQEQGGGASGRGQYPGTQSNAGSGNQAGGFGYGANQTSTNYRYCSGGAGGGWYGGGTHRSDSSTSYIYYTGGGSGFVNIAANSSYRPSGYTGLQLDSGTTTAGDTSHPSTSGGTETGHSGNGYARITVIS